MYLFGRKKKVIECILFFVFASLPVFSQFRSTLTFNHFNFKIYLGLLKAKANTAVLIDFRTSRVDEEHFPLTMCNIIFQLFYVFISHRYSFS